MRTRRRVLVVFAHPAVESFGHAVLNSTLTGLARAGHDVRVRDLYAEGFDSRLSVVEKRGHLASPATKPHLASHFADLEWCTSIVFVHPTWWGAQPAVLKGWIDRTWACGVAWELPAGAKRLKPRMRHVRRLVTVTTHGSPWRVNALQGVPGRRIVNRALRVLCHPLCRTRWIALYDVDGGDAERRTRFLRRVERRLARL